MLFSMIRKYQFFISHQTRGVLLYLPRQRQFFSPDTNAFVSSQTTTFFSMSPKATAVLHFQSMKSLFFPINTFLFLSRRHHFIFYQTISVIYFFPGNSCFLFLHRHRHHFPFLFIQKLFPISRQTITGFFFSPDMDNFSSYPHTTDVLTFLPGQQLFFHFSQ